MFTQLLAPLLRSVFTPPGEQLHWRSVWPYWELAGVAPAPQWLTPPLEYRCEEAGQVRGCGKGSF